MIITSAPGKIILFGEHAVVYDKLGIACSVDKRCFVKVFFANENSIFIEAKDFNLSKSLREKELFDFFETINNLKNKDRFDEIKEIFRRDRLAPSFFVIANVLKKYGFRGLKLKIESEIPKNLGSSSAVFSAIALGVSKLLGKDLLKKEVSDFAYQGDLIAHGGTPSGIDNSIVTYGGYLKYKKSKGIELLKVNFKIPLLIVDSGEEVRTGETVSYVRKQKKENPEFINSILDSLDNISEEALKALNLQNFENLGNLMFKYYQELKKLDISTPKLEQIIDIALKNKALGAKPTGSWGGGCCLVLAKNQNRIISLMKKFEGNGFKSFQSKIGVEGVKLIS
ncbi:mevalonate kinase [Patescibacteria group bacterium]|nr:mevalonate kinase [Patescibacteria group bacterium]